MKRIFLLGFFALASSCVLGQSSTTVHHRSILPPQVFDENPVQANSPQTDTAFFTNVQINNTSQQNETGIAVNPLNPKQLVCSANDFACNFNTMRYFNSTDGGLTWTAHCLPVPAGASWDDPFDPTVAFDSKGNAYLCFGDAADDASGNSKQNGVFVAKSTDGGATFKTPVGVATQLQNVKSGSGGSQPFEDKYYIACDANPSSPHHDNVYVTWSHQPVGLGFTIMCSTSTDGGTTWSAMIGASSGNDNPQGSMPIVGPDGTLYVSWGDNSFGVPGFPPSVVVTRSTDGGQSFNSEKTVAQAQSIGTYNSTYSRSALPDKQNMRIATFPSIAVDRSGGAHNGEVYLAWHSRDNNGDPHIFLSSSTDRGITWKTPRVIDQGNSGEDVYMPGLACDPVNGDVVLDYFDSRNSTDNTSADLYCSISHDGAQTFSEYRISSVTTKIYSEGQPGSGGYYFGDYQGITAYNGTAWPCWWDCRTGASYNNCHIYTAVIRNSANPVTNLTGHSSCANPTEVVLSWNDPTKTTTGSMLSAFMVDILRNGIKIDSVNAGVQTYTDINLIPGTVNTYSIVVSSASGNSDAATVTVTVGGGSSANAPTNFVLRPVTGGIEARWINPSTHIDGTAACDFHAIYFYNDTASARIDSLVLPSDSAGASATKILILDTTKIWNIYARGITVLNGKITLGDSTSHWLSFAGAPRPSPNLNFDGAAPQLYETGTWGIITNVAFSKPNSLCDNNKQTSTNGKTTFTQLPPFVLKLPDTTLTFRHVFLGRSNTFASVLISTDNGASWNTVSKYDTSTDHVDWHDSVSVSTWVLERRSIHAHGGSTFANIGDTVSLRFELKTASILSGKGWTIDNINLMDTTAGIRESNIIPSAMMLDQNYPNPFNPTTVIHFGLAHSGLIDLSIVDALGRVVTSLVHASLESGSYATEFHAENIPSGTYFSVLRGDGTVLTKQMILLK